MTPLITFLKRWLVRLRGWASPQRWGLAVVAAALVTNLVAFDEMHDVKPMSDGIYTWLYARSLAFDHDIDFTNDYRVCGDRFEHNKDRGGGHPDNPFYIGPSIFLVPAIELARVFQHIPDNADEAVKIGCKGPIMTASLRVGALVGALLVWLSYRASRRLADDYVSALAAGLFAFGTTLSTYATYAAAYAHVYDGACVAAFLVLSLRAYEAPARIVRWALVGVALAACVLHRVTNAPLAVIPLVLAVRALYPRWGRLAASIAAVALTSFLLGVVPQLMIYKYLYGHVLGVVPQGQYFMQPAHSHMWLVLFTAKGLFFMAPVAWLSVGGLVLALRAGPQRAWLVAAFLVFVIEVYVQGMTLDWDASSTIGARRMIALFPILTVFAALALDRAVAWFTANAGRVRALVTVVLLAPLGSVFVGEALYYASPGHYYDYYPSQEQTYASGFGAFWRTVDREIGAVALLPAVAVFAWRYGLPHEAFWGATYLNWFLRDHQKMTFLHSRIDLKEKNLKAGLRGFSRDAKGAKLVAKRGAVVFCAGWPYATDLAIVASAAQPVTVRVRIRGFWGLRTSVATMQVGTAEAKYFLPIAAHTFDSGIEEVIFDTDDTAAHLHVVSLELLDKGEYAPVE